MIIIQRDGKKVWVGIKTRLDNEQPDTNTTIWFCRESGTVFEAELLERFLLATVSDSVVAVKHAAYEDGWMDAKAKKKRGRLYPPIIEVRFPHFETKY